MKTVRAIMNKSSKKWNMVIGNKTYSSANKKYMEWRAQHNNMAIEFVNNEVVSAPKTDTVSTGEKFNINTRFSFVEKLVKMVASGTQASGVITGQGGLGKSYTVLKTLELAGYNDVSEVASFEVGTKINRQKSFVVVKGYSTPKGLFRTLYENNGSVIVFDDCDSVLKDPVALNILKGALDSYGKRVISWNADMRDEDLPRSFNFEGKVIFISNISQEKIDQAIRSRSMLIDLSMTDEQKIDRMEYIVSSPEFMPEFEMNHKQDALGLIRELASTAKEISLRTLIQVTKIRSCNDDWKEMAEYLLCE